MKASFVCGVLAALLWLGAFSARVHADGSMVVRDEVLFRTGAAARGYCEVAGPECDTVLTKVLSGYGYLRGALRGGVALEPTDEGRNSAYGALHLDGVSAALPGGDMAVARLDGVLGGQRGMTRLRLTLIELENVFVCADSQRGGLALPFIGMTTRHCSGRSVFGLDLRLLRMQWDALDDHLLAEWGSVGPAFELLGNGLGQAHLMQSVVLALPVDLQSRHLPERDASGTSLGAGLRLAVLYRTPHWESRLRVRHRMVLSGAEGFGRGHNVEGELRLLRNWFVTDALVMQAGLSLAVSWAAQPWLAQALLAQRDARLSVSAGLYVGWVSEAPSI